MKLDKRTTSVLGIAVIVIIVLLSGFFIINPSWTAQQELSDELEAAKQQSEDYQAQITQLEGVRENIATYEEQDAELSTKFPSQADIELLLDDITQAGRSAGVSEITRIQTDTPELVVSEEEGAEAAPAEEAPVEGEAPADGEAAPAAPANDLAIMALTVTAEGSENSLTEYATELTQMPRAFLINSMSITCDDTCTLTTTGTTYLHRPTVSPDSAEEAPVEEPALPEDTTTEG